MLLVLAFLTTGALTSCSVSEDDLLDTSVQATGDELDDPAEPDEED